MQFARAIHCSNDNSSARAFGSMFRELATAFQSRAYSRSNFLSCFRPEKIRFGSISKATHRRARVIQSDRVARVAPLRNRHQVVGEKQLQERCADI